MAHCVITAVVDTDQGGALVPACVVHTAHAPCPHDGEPASPVPLHALAESMTRDEALRMWQNRTHRQRPLVIHALDPVRGPEDHVIEKDGAPCWCDAEILPAEGK